MFENHPKSRIQHCERSELRLHFEWTKFEFWHFSSIFVRLKVTCLVTLFDRELKVSKNSQN